MDVTVVVATFGHDNWVKLAEERALPSVPDGVPYVHCHGASLHDARNTGIAKVDTEWVCYLDADDELEPGYFEAMDLASADLRPPAVRYLHDGWERRPLREARIPEQVRLEDGNWLVVGTLVRTEMVRQVGGWRDWPFYEDWDLWLRCWQAGATIEPVPDAVYRAHVREGSRNRAPFRRERIQVHRAIQVANGLVPA